MTAVNGGETVTAPELSTWTNNGDTHTAIIEFRDDAHYTFSISCTDMAGNSAARTEPDFYVDKTKPEVKLTGIKDQSANNTKDKIGFVLTATDTNFDVFLAQLTMSVVRDGKLVKTLFEKGVTKDLVNGKMFVVDDLPEDGIYSLSALVVDKAGNEYTQAMILNAKGEETLVDKTVSDTLVKFSVNRNGSTFDIDDHTTDVIGKYYVQNVNNNIVIVEVNADTLEEYHVTLNGSELKEGKDYTVVSKGGNSEWMEYTYTIDKTLFADEGEYNVVVYSTDRATNNAFSDVKDAGIDFVVDRTAPVVSVSGMESGGRYQIEKQTVTIIPKDDGGALSSVLVTLVSDDGTEIRKLIDLSGEELLKALEENGGMLSFEIEEGLYQNVRVVCKDCSIGDDGSVNTFEELFTEVSVSSSTVKILWANRNLRYGVLGGVAGLSLLIILLAVKRKKDKDKTAAA